MISPRPLDVVHNTPQLNGHFRRLTATNSMSRRAVRVPAMAWWPGMIAPNRDPVDILHITALFTTAARPGGALGNIPNDRVTDGVDQTALLLLGERQGRDAVRCHARRLRLVSLPSGTVPLPFRVLAREALG